jgi:hypothetical protein
MPACFLHYAKCPSPLVEVSRWGYDRLAFLLFFLFPLPSPKPKQKQKKKESTLANARSRATWLRFVSRCVSNPN